MNKIEEIEYLKRRWYLYYNFMSKYPEAHSLLTSFVKKNIDDAFENGKINILRSGNKDITSDLKHMPLSDRIQLKKILYKELNEGIEDVESFYRDKLIKVLTKKRITTSDEFELVQSYLKDEINIGKVDDVDGKLNKLYFDYIDRNYRGCRKF